MEKCGDTQKLLNRYRVRSEEFNLLIYQLKEGDIHSNVDSWQVSMIDKQTQKTHPYRVNNHWRNCEENEIMNISVSGSLNFFITPLGYREIRYYM